MKLDLAAGVDVQNQLRVIKVQGALNPLTPVTSGLFV